MYRHILLVFNKPVIGDFQNVNVKCSMLDILVPNKKPVHTVLNTVRVYNPSESYAGNIPLNRQVIIELDGILNNVDGDILVEYISGLYGEYMEPVLPFSKYFTPTEMPNVPTLSCIDNIYIEDNNTIYTDKINNSQLDSDSTGTATVSSLQYYDSYTVLEYIGQIKP